MGIDYETPERIAEDKEQIALLRRELSMLSEKYRDITVKYYINGMSYKDIAAQLHISEEYVRYTLFKVRKILKEGIEKEKKYGVQSYNPKIFAPDSWGNRCYLTKLFKRRLPGNILFAAYENPITTADLSLELGVASPYLEDELNILVKSGVLKQNKDKCLTDIVILTGAFERARNEWLQNEFASSVGQIGKAAKDFLDNVSALDIACCDKSENRLLRLIDDNIIVSENGKLKPSFPVFTETELKRFDELLQPLVKQMILMMDSASDKAAERVCNYVPNHLRQKARLVAKFDSLMAAAGTFMDVLVESGFSFCPLISASFVDFLILL